MRSPLTSWLDAAARDHGDRPAVVCGDAVWTWGAIDALAWRVAAGLVSAGVEPGDRIVVDTVRSGRVLAFLLGVLRAGAVYVPVDPESPGARVGLVVRDCQPRGALVGAHRLRAWAAARIAVPRIWVDDMAADGVAPAPRLDAHVVPFGELVQAPAAGRPQRTRELDDPAYVLYTSGSTGTPKGVVLSHRNAWAFVDWARQAVEVGPKDRLANYAPLHFDLSVFDYYAAMAAGACTVVVPDALRRAPAGLVQLVADQRVTVWYSVPSPLVWMLRRGGLEGGRVPQLRAVLFAGEVFPVRELAALMQRLPGRRMFNWFGPTETNVCLAHEVVEPPDPDGPPVPIGTPASGCTVQVVDAAGRPVPTGEPGELLVDGPNVMLGYWRDGAVAPARRPYPTGDRVRVDGQGVFHFLGRRDDQVKVHGYRIELGEVEHVLRRHPDVEEAVAVVAGDRLAVAVVARRPLSVLEVKRHCAAALPPYMVPRRVRLANALPRTSTGKVDRRRVAASFASEVGTDG